eukprot:768739-Hanusia_phi.AAC.10
MTPERSRLKIGAFAVEIMLASWGKSEVPSIAEHVHLCRHAETLSPALHPLLMDSHAHVLRQLLTRCPGQDVVDELPQILRVLQIRLRPVTAAGSSGLVVFDLAEPQQLASHLEGQAEHTTSAARVEVVARDDVANVPAARELAVAVVIDLLHQGLDERVVWRPSDGEDLSVGHDHCPSAGVRDHREHGSLVRGHEPSQRVDSLQVLHQVQQVPVHVEELRQPRLPLDFHQRVQLGKEGLAHKVTHHLVVHGHVLGLGVVVSDHEAPVTRPLRPDRHDKERPDAHR